MVRGWRCAAWRRCCCMRRDCRKLQAAIQPSTSSSGRPPTCPAADVLLLVPGIPLINAAEDLIKGHMVTGIVRGLTGVLISLGIALGLLLAMRLMGVGTL